VSGGLFFKLFHNFDMVPIHSVIGEFG
jgi:hypothetical protein